METEGHFAALGIERDRSMFMHDPPSALFALESQRRAKPHLDLLPCLLCPAHMAEEVAERHLAAEEHFDIASLEPWRLLEGRTPASGASKGRRLANMA